MANSGWLRLGLLTAGAAAAGSMWTMRRQQPNRDAAPVRTARNMRMFGDYLVAGATVTIQASPETITQAWQNSAELWAAMEYTPFPEGSQPGLLITPPELHARISQPLLLEIVTDKPDEVIAWRSGGDGQDDVHGRIRFHDNGSKGTAIEIIFAFKPEVLRTGLQTGAALLATVNAGLLRDLRRMKMLIETGEIATACNQRSAA
ncbi:hypothetical protein [Blastomonas sp.]|uniref:hypothetical protein n=1 Tax=Blastomonas sp. TaxID=1909299 RepID=UPI00359444E3